MALLKQSTAFTRTFIMVDSTDHLAAKTGLTCTVNISKAGGTFAAAGGTVTEIANGVYKIALTTTDTNTLGDLAYHITATGADPTQFVDQVVAIDVGDAAALGLSRLDAAVTTRAAIADYTSARATKIDNLDALVSSRLASNAMVLDSGTAQAGATTTVTLRSGSSATTDFYKGQTVVLTGGTGAGQDALISTYNGTTKVATFADALPTAPDATTTYVILATDMRRLLQLDAAVSSRSTLTAAQAAAGVWDEARSGHVTAGSFGQGVASVQGNVTGSVASVTGAVGSVTGAVASVTGAVGSVTGNVGGNVTGSVGSVATGGITAASIAADAIGASELAADAVAEIADAVWDEPTTGHNTSGTFGQRTFPVRAGTAQAGAAGTITLDSGASGSDSFYNNAILFITGGTGAGQSRIISGYVGATKVATVNGNWITNPDNTSVFVILPFGAIPGATAPTAAAVATAVWDEPISGHLTAGTTGNKLNGAASAGDPWTTTLPGAYGAGTAGKIVGDNLNATVGSRSSHAAADIWAVGTRTLTGTVTVGTNNDKTGYALTAGEHTSIASDAQTGLTAQGYTSTRAGYLDTLNGLVAAVWAAGTRTLTGFGTLVSDIWAAGTRTLTSGGGGGGATAAEIADAVWDEPLAGHLTAGSTGSKLSSLSGGAGSGGVAFTYTVTRSDNGSPLADVDVRFTTDAAGANLVAAGTTDAFGQVVVFLDAGTYYVWRTKPGFRFTDPDTESVS